MVRRPWLQRRFISYFNDTRFDPGICQTAESAKGAWLLGFVRLGGSGGLDMRFLGRKWQKKKADSLPDDKKRQEQTRKREATAIVRSPHLWNRWLVETHFTESRCGAPAPWAEVEVEKRISPLRGSQGVSRFGRNDDLPVDETTT
jgi:hypothetical protein